MQTLALMFDLDLSHLYLIIEARNLAISLSEMKCERQLNTLYLHLMYLTSSSNLPNER